MESSSFLSLLHGIKKSGAGWTARCPAHDDSQNSLSIAVGQTGILLKCFAGCSLENVVAALDLELRDLFSDNGGNGLHGRPASRPSTSIKPAAVHSTPEEATETISALFKTAISEGYNFSAIYTYDGYFRVRFNHPKKGKFIRPFYKSVEGWQHGEPSFPRGGKPLYRKHEITLNPTAEVWVVEGEKCADTMVEFGFISTTSGSVSSAGGADWTPLKGRHVIIWPDFDAPGQRYGDDVESRLVALGCHVKKIDVEALGLPVGGDVVDWLEANPSATKGDVEALPRLAPKAKNEDWPDPIPLDAVKNLPTLPSDVFAGWLGAMVDGVSQATETPRELAASFGLAVMGIASQKIFCVMPEPGYTEPLSAWTIAALESGNRKTSVKEAMTRPLSDWEKNQADVLEPKIKRLASGQKTQEARIANLRSKASKLEGDDFITAQHEIAELEAALPDVPALPRLWCQDITPERLGVVMSEHGERIGLLSDEGGIFDTLAGRYSAGIPNLDLFLQGHAGAPVRVDRVGRESVLMNNPALTLGLSPQPEVLKRLADNTSFRGRGLLARFLYFLPSSPLGRRTLEPKPVAKNITDEYEKAIRRLLDFKPAVDENGNPRPHVLRFSLEAHSEWKAMARYVEKELRDGGKFEHIRDWAGKLPGACARIAGLLHVAEYAFSEPWKHEINAETMNRALSLAAVFSQHALVVFALIKADESLDAARRVYRWIERSQAETFTARDCFQALKGHFRDMNSMEPGLRVLLERAVIRELEGGRKPGRPSLKFVVNPRIVEGWE
jgi:hypothetical protein